VKNVTRVGYPQTVLPRQAIVLAAGRGVRLRPLTDRLPKPLVQLCGRPLLDYHLHGLRRAGVNHCVINTAHLGGLIEAHVGDGARFGLTVSYSREPREALETGGGISHALPLLAPAPFIAVNADIYCEYDFNALLGRPMALAHLVLVDNPAHHRNGDFSLSGHVVGNASTPRLTFSGIAVYQPGFFAAAPAALRFPLTPLLRDAAQRGRVTGQRYGGCWFDIGTVERLTNAAAYLKQKSSSSS